MKKIFLLFVVCCVLIVTVPSFAAETPYTLLAPIPLEGAGAGVTQTTVASQYIRGVFMLIIGLATGLAVIMIIYGGIKYMSTDAFTGKSEARETIQNAIWGLLLVIAAWLILYTINPKLVEFNLNIPIQAISTAITGGTPVPSAGCPNCVVVGVPHKSAPLGCAPPGPCTVDPTLNNKLVALNQLSPLLVSDSYPPPNVVQHQDPCHGNGTCVDITISSMTTQNAATFLANANSVGGLGVLVEVTSAAKKTAMTQAGIPENQVKVTAGNGDHFHVKLQ